MRQGQVFIRRGGSGRLNGQAMRACIAALLLPLTGLKAETVLSGSVRSACEIDYPPFCIVSDDGHADGFSVDLLRAVLAKMERDVVFRAGQWADVRGWLEQGAVEVLPLVGRTPEREPIFDFTVPYLTMHGAIVVRKDTADVQTLADLRGRAVAVMAGDNAEEFLRREDRGIELLTLPTFVDALHALSEGRCDGVVVQRLVASRLIDEAGFDNLKIVERPIMAFAQTFCFAVREGDHDLLSILNEGLALAVADGTQRRLHAKWFGHLQLPADRPILVGGDHEYPPFEFRDASGRPSGFTVDLTRAIAREMNLNVHIRLGAWAQTLEAVQHGDLDVIQGIFYSAARERTMDFSAPYLVSHYVSVVHRDAGSAPETLADLAGLRLAVQRGDVAVDFLAEAGYDDIPVMADTQADVLGLVRLKRCDAAVVPRASALRLIHEHRWGDLVLGKRALFEGAYCYAVAEGRQALLANFSEGLAAVKASGEYQDLYEKWFGIHDTSLLSWRGVLRYMVPIAVPLLVIAVLALLWSWTLRGRVVRRTAQLRASMEFQRAMVACSPVALYAVDLDGKVLVWNASAERIFGWSASEAIGAPLPIIPPDKRDEFEALLAQVSSGTSFSDRELTRIRKDGTEIPISLSVAPLLDGRKRMIGIMGAAEDIRVRKHAVAALQRRLDYEGALFRISTLSMEASSLAELEDACVRILGDVLDVSRVYIFAYDEAADTLSNTVEWVDAGITPQKDQLQAVPAEVVSWWMARMHRNEVIRYASIEDIPDTTMRDILSVQNIISILAVPFFAQGRFAGFLGFDECRIRREWPDEDVELLHMVARIIGQTVERHRAAEEREALQGQLLQAHKMEAVGRLAGGVAHDFNNFLMGILNYAEFCRYSVASDHPIHEWLDEITRETQRCANLTRQLLAFARQQAIAPKTLDVNQSVAGLLKMLRRLIGENIHLVWQPETDVWPVRMDPGQLDQVLANLCINARDAMREGGTVTIETRNVSLTAADCAGHEGFRPGQFVLLSVADEGCGIDRESLTNIFEPFWTTKEDGHGIGLGLATVYGIVEQNKGFIKAQSEPGQGATFRIYLPRERHTAVTESEPVEQTERPRGHEKILVVEDDAAVRATMRLFLEQLGYRVQTAESADVALQIADRQTRSIDLLIADIVLPDIHGPELAERLKKDIPGLKVLYMSGYTADSMVRDRVIAAGIHFMQKPLDHDDLARAVRDALDG